ncbi:MAG: GTPase HflX [Planctomycetales bacterium]
MAEPKRNELKVREKRAILVSVILPETPVNEEDPLDELKGLVKTAGVEVVDTLVQRRQFPDAKTYLGKGKVEELTELFKSSGAELIVFDNNLNPAQGRNLETATGAIIVDRSEIILDIFASHARTYEARLQVELAQLLYFRPRLKRMWTHLSREGGMSNRGAGEQQLEIDRRLIDKRVAELKERLSVVQKQRERMVAQRRDQQTVSLVGYTNAGKSTLMNALTGADVYMADQLFATLDTRTRAWNVPHSGTVLLSDTVGFIRDLPHNLVASFRSTLEEARHADVLLHVVDASHPQAEEQIATVNQVLKEIDVETSEAILVLNKIDAVPNPSFLDVLRSKYPGAISVSARQKIGLDRLGRYVAERLSDGFADVVIETSAGNGKLLAFLAEHAEVTERTFVDSRMTIRCRMAKRSLHQLSEDGDTRIRIESSDSLPAFVPEVQDAGEGDDFETSRSAKSA